MRGREDGLVPSEGGQGVGVGGIVTQVGAPLHSHWLAMHHVTGHCPRCIH